MSHHDFRDKYLRGLSYCLKCGHFIWGVTKYDQRGMQCRLCFAAIHQACFDDAMKTAICQGDGSISAKKSLPPTKGKLVLTIHRASGVPRQEARKKNSCYVKVAVAGASAKTKVIADNSDPEWNEELELDHEVTLQDIVTMEVKADGRMYSNVIGCVTVSVADLVHRPETTFLLSAHDGTMLVKPSRNTPTTLTVSVHPSYFPQDWPAPVASPHVRLKCKLSESKGDSLRSLSMLAMRGPDASPWVRARSGSSKKNVTIHISEPASASTPSSSSCTSLSMSTSFLSPREGSEFSPASAVATELSLIPECSVSSPLPSLHAISSAEPTAVTTPTLPSAPTPEDNGPSVNGEGAVAGAVSDAIPNEVSDVTPGADGTPIVTSVGTDVAPIIGGSEGTPGAIDAAPSDNVLDSGGSVGKASGDVLSDAPSPLSEIIPSVVNDATPVAVSDAVSPVSEVIPSVVNDISTPSSSSAACDVTLSAANDATPPEANPTVNDVAISGVIPIDSSIAAPTFNIRYDVATSSSSTAEAVSPPSSPSTSANKFQFLANTPASPAPVQSLREFPSPVESKSISGLGVASPPSANSKSCSRTPMSVPPPLEDQLEFEEGQYIHVLERVSSDWWWADIDGKQGYVSAALVEPADPPTERHVMMISRGTRGDVQPFVALARGLAEQLGWMVTICTELRWKDFVKDNSVVSRGCIRFRPSGGDTMMRTNTMLAKWAMQHKSELMQVSMLARCEGEFFDSEPILFHWAKELEPDLLIYGFTLTNVAMIISEALKIPMMGFVLQPTCLPSTQYPTVTTISSNFIQEQLGRQVVGHGFQQALKMVMENNPITAPLNAMRKKHNLEVFSGFLSETWSEIIAQDSPVIVPISPFAFGGKPQDWHPSASLTEFIFLRGGGTPKLAPDLAKFIAEAKAAHAPTVVMGFSSMPVPREDIMSIAHKMIESCACHPRVIALVGQRDMSKEHLSSSVEEKQAEFLKQGLLYEAAGAPFGLLFDLVDCIIMHGGLGTTAEALRAAKPTITTGVLLMDQRFWGQRVHDLGVGPPPVHISDFHSVCAEYVDKALIPTDGHFTEWQQNAMAIAPQIQALTPDGVLENVREVVRLAQRARPIKITKNKQHFCDEDGCSNPVPCATHEHLSRSQRFAETTKAAASMLARFPTSPPL